ncbi:hypothetical protein EAO28_18935 [Klebsiella pneumoniae]|uniref:Uncharacterized protein n=1 Tax=Klebsiella pneumoniae TaxID=573 RepID=A0A3P2EJG4_KLEPN|nr:hypothetical protein EAO28_18935 [Klebsiella pneumoniae]
MAPITPILPTPALIQSAGLRVGWLEKYRQEAPQRVISGLSVAGRDESNKIIASGDYGTVDALVLDGWQSAIAEQYRNGLVSICSAETLFRKEWPLYVISRQTGQTTSG